MSAAERELEIQLRGAKLRWVPEFPLGSMVGRKWRVDFLVAEGLPIPVKLAKQVLVEVEGGSFVGGRHTQGTGFEADCLKYGCAAALGWRVLRVTPSMIRSGLALHLIEAALGRVALKIPPTKHKARALALGGPERNGRARKGAARARSSKRAKAGCRKAASVKRPCSPFDSGMAHQSLPDRVKAAAERARR